LNNTQNIRDHAQWKAKVSNYPPLIVNETRDIEGRIITREFEWRGRTATIGYQAQRRLFSLDRPLVAGNTIHIGGVRARVIQRDFETRSIVVYRGSFRQRLLFCGVSPVAFGLFSAALFSRSKSGTCTVSAGLYDFLATGSSAAMGHSAR